jgi:hypothetical protein
MLARTKSDVAVLTLSLSGGGGGGPLPSGYPKCRPGNGSCVDGKWISNYGSEALQLGGTANNVSILSLLASTVIALFSFRLML